MPPTISEDELSAFHATHFSSTSTDHFTSKFLGPEEDQHAEGQDGDDDAEYNQQVYAAEENDGLGYYADGVKRTLTDEQIAIFRHSEIQALLRARRHAKEAKEEEEELVDESPEITPTPPVEEPKDTAPAPIPEPRPIIGPVMEIALEDGELKDDTTEIPTPPAASNVKQSQKKSKKKKKPQKAQQRDPKPKGFFKQSVKPDLRKRTWDVVDKGVDGLDYDEVDGGASSRPNMAKRRQISYDD